MSAVAVDIVLLPDEAMMDLAIAANASLVEKFNSEIVLNKKDCLPHISLAMGCIEHEDIERAGELLQPLAAIIPKRLKTGGIQKSTSSSGEIVSVIGIQRTKKLQKLHEKVSGTIKPFFTYDVKEDMVAGGKAGQTTLQWIANYPDKASYSNFSPHITIGYGDLQDIELPQDFAVSSLAICHLGDHCTCRKILWSVEI
jgi:2'-5' RNA ligase